MNDSRWRLCKGKSIVPSPAVYVGESNQNVKPVSYDDEDWIEEEERLLNWSETPDFNKHPLNKIAATFIYTDADQNVVGVLKTEIAVEPKQRSSLLHRSTFMAKINAAINPDSVIPGSVIPDWSKKTYTFNDVAIYCVPLDHEEINTYIPTTKITALQFSNDVAKIPTALTVFEDLYEISVIMREAKSILKQTNSSNRQGKTKKVHISNELPKEYVFSKISPASRRTKKVVRRSIRGEHPAVC